MDDTKEQRKAFFVWMDSLDRRDRPRTSLEFEAAFLGFKAGRAALAAQGVPAGFVVVNAGALQMVRNALRRDADEGKKARGEMLAELDAATRTPAQGAPADPCVVLWQAMNEAEKVGNRTDDKLIVEFLRRAGYCIAATSAPPQAQQDCYCGDEISLQMVSGGAAPDGLYGRVTLKVGGEYVEYVKASAQAQQAAQGVPADEPTCFSAGDAVRLKVSALAVFDGPECPQIARDVIEWYHGSLLVEVCDTAPAQAQQAAPLTQAQRIRLWNNSPQVHGDVVGRDAFERLVKLVEAVHRIGASSGSAP